MISLEVASVVRSSAFVCTCMQEHQESGVLHAHNISMMQERIIESIALLREVIYVGNFSSYRYVCGIGTLERHTPDNSLVLSLLF